jgi:hypothetical protein
MMPSGYDGPEERAARDAAFAAAPTLLESLFWAWLCHMPLAAELYFAELVITPLDDGPGDEPDEFRGEP